MIKVIIGKDHAVAVGPLPIRWLSLATQLSGRKSWGEGGCRFECSPSNLRILHASDLEFDFVGETSTIDGLARVGMPDAPEAPPEFIYPGPMYDFHKATLREHWGDEARAYFHECGLGKTSLAIVNMGMLHAAGLITGGIVIAPIGVDAQWENEQLPLYWDRSFPITTILLRKQKRFDYVNKGFTLVVGTTDMLRSKMFETLKDFALAHGPNKMFCVIDEAHRFRRHESDRTKKLIGWSSSKQKVEGLVDLIRYKRIMTGSPGDALGCWSQFYFLNWKILGYRYVTSFIGHFCVLGGYDGRTPIDQKNTEEFWALVAPYTDRLTKAETNLQLPPKIYAQRRFQLAPETRAKYDELRETWMVNLAPDQKLDVKNAMTAMMRLQQITCGFLPAPDGSGLVEIGKGERLDAMIDIVKQSQGQVVIWGRFTHDIETITKRLEVEFGRHTVATYYGLNAAEVNAKNKQMFVSGQRRFFVSNAQMGGTGLDGLQVAQTMIFFSNSFNYIERVQAEDRGHRGGMKGTLTIHDLIGMNTVDAKILRVLRHRKDIASLTFDEIRRAIENPAAEGGDTVIDPEMEKLLGGVK